jgi:uncharacterized cupredoxin-like copper-binding protein
MRLLPTGTRSIRGHGRTRAIALLCGGAALAAALGASWAEAPPAGSPAAGATGAADLNWSDAVLVTVELVDERFVPNTLRFRRGVPYHLRLENTGTSMHEFTAPGFFKAVIVKNPEALDAQHREIVLQPRERRDVYFVPQEPGRYELACADHDWAGMTGEITIE